MRSSSRCVYAQLKTLFKETQLSVILVFESIENELCTLYCAFSRTAHPNNFTLDTTLPWVLGNTPAKCEVNQMNDCRDNRGQTDILLRPIVGMVHSLQALA